MKRKNKKEVLDITGDYVKVGENHCGHCVYSDKTIIPCAKVRCTYHKPKVFFHHRHGWVCFSFSQRMLSNNEDEGGKQY